MRAVTRPALAIIIALVCCAVWMQSPALSHAAAGAKKRPSSRGGQSPKELTDRGKELMREGKTGAALKLFRAAVRKDSAYARGYKFLGVAYYRLKHRSRALKNLSHYIELEPSDPRGYLLRADARNYLGRHADALRDYDRALALKPDLEQAHLGRGLALAGLERYKDAIKSYNHVLRLHPHHEEALSNLGRAHMLAQQPLSAVYYFQEAMKYESDPDYRRRIKEWMDEISRPGGERGSSGGSASVGGGLTSPRSGPYW